jgi:hypothetical protein
MEASMSRVIVTVVMVSLLSSSSAYAQATPHSSRWRTTWTIVGAGGGFGVGVWAGLAAFDQAINSDRKVWTSAMAGAALGGVGGYLIGRAQDRRGQSPARTYRPFDRSVIEDVGRSFAVRR